MRLIHPSPTLAIPLLSLPLACTGDDVGDDEVADETIGTGTETGDGDGDGDGGPCTAPGSTVAGIDPFVPAAEDPLPTCGEGWASDAPLEEAAWAVAMAPSDSPNGYYYYIPTPTVRALSGKRAVVVESTQLHWFDGSGQKTASVGHGFDVDFDGLRPESMAVRDDDHVFLAANEGGDITIREFFDGEQVGEVMVPTPGETRNVIALHEFSPDEWLLVGNEFDPMEGSEMFFMRVDAQGNELLRKATSGAYCYYCYSYASLGEIDGAGNLLFGSANQAFIVDTSDGSVVTNTTLPGVRGLVGSATAAGFVWTSQAFLSSQDAVITAINGFAVQQWTQTYERILLGNDGLVAAANRPDGGYVAAGFDGIWWTPPAFTASTQPLVIALDGEGNAEWVGRLAIAGDARSVDVASDGSVAVAGVARTGGVSYEDIDTWVWVAVW